MLRDLWHLRYRRLAADLYSHLHRLKIPFPDFLTKSTGSASEAGHEETIQDKYMAFFILSQILTVRTLPVPVSKASTVAEEKMTDSLLVEDNISDVTSPWTSEVLFEKHLEL